MSSYWLRKLCVGFLLLGILNASHTLAKDVSAYSGIFRLAFSSSPTTLDPQKTTLLADYRLMRHFFDPLFVFQNGEVSPVLMESYSWKTPRLWEFKLKEGVLFHDGSELTSQDIVATFQRAFRLKNATYEQIKNYQIRMLDDYRFELESSQPDSELLWNLENLMVIKHTAEQADSEGFDSGEYLVGTGPYRLLERKAFNEFRLEAFPQYHRGAAFIQNLVIRVEVDPDKRMADFLDGKLDMMPYLSTKGLSSLKQKANITNESSDLLYLLSLDTWREQTPDVRGLDGKPLSRNPFQDLRVRQAISKALNREQLVFQLLGSRNNMQVAGQLLNENARSYDSGLLPEKQDIDEAKRLLKEAGYPAGFQVTIRDVNTRRHYLEAIAPMLAQIGIEAKITVLPAKEYFQSVDKRAFSAMFYFNGSDNNLGGMLKFLLYSRSKNNSGGYTNLVLDQQIDDAMAQLSIDLKERKLREAQRTVIKDLAVIPILFTSNDWVIRQDMLFLPTDKLLTEAYYIRPND